MDGVQMRVASEWAGLSASTGSAQRLRRVLGFGERIRGVVNGLCHGLTDGNGWTVRKWESLRGGWACPCGGLWVSGGVVVGERKDEG